MGVNAALKILSLDTSANRDYNVTTYGCQSKSYSHWEFPACADPESSPGGGGTARRCGTARTAGRVMIVGVKHPRAGWAAAAREMHANGDDQLLDPFTPTKFNLAGCGKTP